jgi:ABC-type glutathione transport system ATPase component
MVDRTVIIASHAVESLAPLANHSILLNDGRAVWTGSGKDLLESEHMEHLKTDTSGQDACHQGSTSLPEQSISKKAFGSETIQEETKEFQIKQSTPKTPKQLVLDEDQAKGAVDLRHWRDIIHLNGGNSFWATVALITIVVCLAPVAEKRVLKWVHVSLRSWQSNITGCGRKKL